MTNVNDVRRAHDLLDELDARAELSQEQEKLLRSFLPELPKQMTLKEIIGHVHDALAGTSGNDWAGDSFNLRVYLEDWLNELHEQLQGLEPAKPAHPEFLETEADYQNAPAGTVAAKDGWLAWIKQKNGDWSCDGGSEEGSILAQTGKRRVLRWGWTNEQL